ncbi:MAG TPA: hypothetical protein VMW83_07370 [Spirochaetia bacterium]|nr:hypothetical protein [Spirochaetia bacterium]
MGSDDNDIDISMSEIKRLSKDVHSFMHALATRLSSSLPEGMLKIVKKKKLLSSRETVQSIAVTVKDKTFLMCLENDHLVTTINKQVNNIVLSHGKCSVPEWFSCLKEELKLVADYHKDAADLLSDFLI